MLTGCGSLAPDGSAATEVATAFRAAVSDADGAAACRLLAPETLHEVAQAAGRPCADAIAASGLGGAGAPTAVDVFGQNARVVFADDTVFVASFPSGWRLTAAGCTPQGDKPYDCTVKGG